MICHICLSFVLLFAVSVALQISTTEPFYREAEEQGDNSTEAYARFMLDKPKVIASGFLVTDIFAATGNRWIRAQILPIGVCFQEGSQNGSARIDQLLMGLYTILRVTNVYTGPNCKGAYSTILLKVPFVKIENNFGYIVRHEASIERAFKAKAPTDALIFTSYYSSDGCSGEVAQYDVVSTREYLVYDDPIGACGFFECFDNVEVMVLKLFDPIYGEANSFCDKNVFPTDEGVSSARQTIEQPFRCTEERNKGQEYYPHFQTIRSAYPTLYNTPTHSTPELPAKEPDSEYSYSEDKYYD